MELADLIARYGSQAALAKAVGVDRAAINRVVKDRRKLGASLAIKVFNATGERIGPMADEAR